MKILLHSFLILSLLSSTIAFAESKSELALKIKFLDDPPYQSSWWPWLDDHFRIEASICNNSDSTWAIEYFRPCNDCNPKFFLEEVTTGIESERTYELDILYIIKAEYSFPQLLSDSCYIDSLDITEWIHYSLDKNKFYRFWLEYQVWGNESYSDTTRDVPIWQDKLVSDTLKFQIQ